NVGKDAKASAVRLQVLREFFKHGRGMIDSSPMYGSAEDVLGWGLRQLKYPSVFFSATKVWTSSADEGPEQIVERRELWGVKQFDLLQVHNLVAWEAHLPMLFAMKKAGELKYVG